MTAYPTWTPASRPGIIPLHPLGFGTVLGRSFTALRQNPRVLLGFALVVQVVAFLVLILGVGAVSFWSFSRLQTVPESSPDFATIRAGSVAIVIVTAFVLGLAAAALGVIVQGVVMTEVARGAVAERLQLARLWAQVRPVAGRLIGYTFLLTLAMLLAIGAVTGIVFALSALAPVAAIVLTVLAVLAAIPVVLWLSTKLLLAPPAIIMERATIRGAIARSWRLTRGRFWPILGIVVLIQLIFGAMAQIVTLPFGLIGGLLTQFIAPTGDADTSAIISVIVTLGLAEIITLLIQSVAIVVQATATSILYIDCRMRREGLDLDLLAYVERRDAGAQDLADPYTLHIGRTTARPPMPAYAPYGPAQPYAAAPPYGAAYPPYGAGSAPTGPAQPPYATPGSGPFPAPPTGPYPPPAAPPASAPPASAPAPTQWAAPGERPDEQGMP